MSEEKKETRGRKPLVSDEEIITGIKAGMSYGEIEKASGHHIYYKRYANMVNALFPTGGTLHGGPAIDLTEGDIIRKNGGFRAVVLEINHDDISCKMQTAKWETLEEVKRISKYFKISRKEYAAGNTEWTRVNLNRVKITKITR